MSDEAIKERFVILRQLDMGKGFDNSTIYGAGGSVSGRVLDIVKNELLLHLPDLDQDQVDEIVNNVVGRLYRPEIFDFDKAQEADEYWRRGMFRAT